MCMALDMRCAQESFAPTNYNLPGSADELFFGMGSKARGQGSGGFDKYLHSSLFNLPSPSRLSSISASSFILAAMKAMSMIRSTLAIRVFAPGAGS